jgi:hypothetical protein
MNSGADPAASAIDLASFSNQKDLWPKFIRAEEASDKSTFIQITRSFNVKGRFEGDANADGIAVGNSLVRTEADKSSFSRFSVDLAALDF